MNTISPSDFPPPWDRITFFLMAAFLLYVMQRFIKKDYVDWEIRLGDRNIGPKMGEKRFTRNESPVIYWSSLILVSFGFSYCLTFSILKNVELWISTSSILISTAIVLMILAKTKIQKTVEHSTDK